MELSASVFFMLMAGTGICRVYMHKKLACLLKSVPEYNLINTVSSGLLFEFFLVWGAFFVVCFFVLIFNMDRSKQKRIKDVWNSLLKLWMRCDWINTFGMYTRFLYDTNSLLLGGWVQHACLLHENYQLKEKGKEILKATISWEQPGNSLGSL